MAVVPGRVSVTTTATLLTADADAGAVIVRNRGTASIDLGGATVTSGAGFQLDAGEAVTVDIAQGEALYGIAAAGTVSVHVLRTGA